MDLLKKLEEEAAGGAVGAGAVAVYSMPLFAMAIKSKKPKKKKVKKRMGLHEAFLRLNEIENGHGDPSMSHPQFDQTEVISKLKALEKKDKIDKGSATTFGLEDDKGNLVRVTVQADQADEFENALSAFLASEEEHDERVPEVAEVLFRLRDRFNILDVTWPEVEEDQEEGQQVAGQEGQAGQEDPNAQPGQDVSADLGADAGMEAPAGTDDVQSLLTQVIDMMRADADARKAEAVARQKEAEAKGHVASVHGATARVKQEEQLLDMEDYFKKKQEEKKESKTLAKLAQWKRETAGEQNAIPDEGADLGAKQEEEELGRKNLRFRSRVPASHLANFILKRIK